MCLGLEVNVPIAGALALWHFLCPVRSRKPVFPSVRRCTFSTPPLSDGQNQTPALNLYLVLDAILEPSRLDLLTTASRSFDPVALAETRLGFVHPDEHYAN
ncbi:MAG: hypothetical protein EOO38_06595 [Cytophagaceae bacterium]|nr:MAG: hypothetical protein EOO38_06595 [Cytophagaceae bacterium]